MTEKETERQGIEKKGRCIKTILLKRINNKYKERLRMRDRNRERERERDTQRQRKRKIERETE
ncbi:hypothetical protein [Cylindrospermopsis raciborskii]|uniref:hypothetical protein n=1 Tax=Cylindrospermopsis raciborskii TaxID=77022 RepID=UPI0022BFA735|nr:hypothetical protein [Cylindrospermopsis raciborskii]MCZ2208053.1 hypothetical protein [Cylindrospermopsis raciborskii PAMP2011]